MEIVCRKTRPLKNYYLLVVLTLIFVSGSIVLAEETDPVFTDWLTAPYIDINSATGFVVEQDGVKDNVLVVDTTNGRVGIGVQVHLCGH